MHKLIVISLLMSLSPLAIASGDEEAGKTKASTLGCVACHGMDGRALLPEYPTLTGQYQDYLQQALMSYRSGKRRNAIMAGFAANLTDEDIKDLAAFYSAQKNGLRILPKD